MKIRRDKEFYNNFNQIIKSLEIFIDPDNKCGLIQYDDHNHCFQNENNLKDEIKKFLKNLFHFDSEIDDCHIPDRFLHIQYKNMDQIYTCNCNKKFAHWDGYSTHRVHCIKYQTKNTSLLDEDIFGYDNDCESDR